MTKSKHNSNQLTATPGLFVTTWETSESIAEVAKKLNCSVEAVQQRARQLRSRKVKLKMMPKGVSKIVTEELNALIDNLRKNPPGSYQGEKS